MNRLRLTAWLAVAVLAGGACNLLNSSDGNSNPIDPTTVAGATFLGTWQSTSSGPPSSDSCTNVDWQVTGVDGTTVFGSFTATCAGGFEVVGTGSGTPSGSLLNWNANGTASQSGASCPFTLSGTATPVGTAVLQIDYTGTVCGIPVQGSEQLDRS